jgi:hypothetical protein
MVQIWVPAPAYPHTHKNDGSNLDARTSLPTHTTNPMTVEITAPAQICYGYCEVSYPGFLPLVFGPVLCFSFFCHFDTFFEDGLEKHIARLFVAFVDSPLNHFFLVAEIGALVQCLAFCATEFLQKVAVKLLV